MFDIPERTDKYPEYAPAGEEAFQTLLQFIANAQKEGALTASEPLPLALVAWSMVHGVAKLATSGRLPFGAEHALEFTRFALESMVNGVANPASR